MLILTPEQRLQKRPLEPTSSRKHLEYLISHSWGHCPFPAPAGDRSGRRPSRKQAPKAEGAAGRRGGPPGQKERARVSPRPESPRRKQAEHRRHQEKLREQERRTTQRTLKGKRKRDGRASLKEQRTPSKKGKEASKKEEMWKQLKKHRCVVALIQVCFQSRFLSPAGLPPFLMRV